MCGIAGIVGKGGGYTVDRAELEAMTDALVHRGPDDGAVEVIGNVGLGNRRLAVIDLPGGHQPLRSVDGALTITYNGELYNYVELRAELERSGYPLATRSDTEVVLGLYAVHGTRMFERMNGMFAFAIHDSRTGETLLARDRFGEKPLYLWEGGDRIAFASEIKSFLRLDGFRAEPDVGALHQYLTFQYCLGDTTLFRGVRRLRPASYVRIGPDGAVREEAEYWSLGFEEDRETPEDELLEELRYLLEDAVRIRLRSDVPVGTYLSGGTDSSLVASIAATLAGRGLPAFTGWFGEGEGFDEREYASAVAAHTGSPHHELLITSADFAASLDRLIWHMDEPAAGPGAFPQLLVSRLAREHVKVVLGGQGGDELFGGYARYLMLYLEESLKGAIFESQDPQRHLVTLQRALPNLSLLQSYVPLLQRFWSSDLFGPMERRYYALVNRAPGLDTYLTAEYRASRDEDALYGAFEQQFNDILNRVSIRAASLFNRMTAYDARTMLQSLLHVEDRTSMAASLESRLPLLDHRIAELMFRMPPLFKYRDGRSKAALLAAAGDRLPPSVLARKDKMGFPVPFVQWARGELREFVGGILLDERARRRGIYEVDEVARLLDGEREYGRELWGLLCLEVWFRTFVDG